MCAGVCVCGWGFGGRLALLIPERNRAPDASLKRFQLCKGLPKRDAFDTKVLIPSSSCCWF